MRERQEWNAFNTFKVPSFMDALKNILNKTIAVSDIVYGEDD